MTDKEMLDSIYADDVSGISMLVETYADLVYGIVSEIMSDIGTPQDVEDCISETFLAFFNNIDDIDLSRGSIKGFLGVIARRRAINLRCTLSADEATVYDEYTVEEMSHILEKEELKTNIQFSDLILRQCLKEIAPQMLSEEPEEEDEEFTENIQEDIEENDEFDSESENVTGPEITETKSSGFGRVLKTLITMVTLVAVITVGVIIFDKFSVPKYVPPTTQATTQTDPFNPLFSAITTGNQKLVEQLITNSLLLTDDVLSFAIQYADRISYDSIRRIAEEVREKYGSTGLDPLIESAIFGDFQAVEEQLRNKDESEMTPAEKLALYFIRAVSE